MAHMRRQHEHLALIDADIPDLAVIDNFQDHVPFDLIEKFLHRIVVKIHPRVGSADDLRDHAVFLEEQLVAHRGFELVSELVDPAVEIERGVHGHGYSFGL